MEPADGGGVGRVAAEEGDQIAGDTVNGGREAVAGPHGRFQVQGLDGQHLRAAFEQTYAEAATVLRESTHCIGYEVAHGIEEPQRYVVRIEWDSLEGHEQGFRRSPAFRTFFASVKPFFECTQEMRHYERILSHPSHEETAAG